MKLKEKGLTLLEVVVGMAIMAVVVMAISLTITTILMNYGQAAEQNVALPQVQSAGYWISRDVQMSKNITASAPNGFPLTLIIAIDADEGNDYDIEYKFEEGTKLMRDDSSKPMDAKETLVADYIDADNTIFSTVNATTGHYKLTVTASRNGDGLTRSYEISQRLSKGIGGEES